jgi:hypothetical protein
MLWSSISSRRYDNMCLCLCAHPLSTFPMHVR